MRAFILALVAIGLVSIPALAAANPALEAAIARHLDAIRGRDMAGMEATITRGADLELIFPNGRRTSTRAEFLAFHREWFADPNWSMSFERQRLIAGRDMAVALYRATYTSSENGQSSTRQNWLAFTFRLEDGEWRLVHDQNTRLPAPGQQ